MYYLCTVNKKIKNLIMPKDFIPLSIKIKDVTKKLKDAGYIVVNTNDEKFAILAERKKILCDNHNDFFKAAIELIKC